MTENMLEFLIPDSNQGTLYKIQNHIYLEFFTLTLLLNGMLGLV